MSTVKMYNVKKKESVEIPEEKCTKVIYERTTKAGKLSKRYAVRYIGEDMKLTKFVSEKDYNQLNCKEG